jgi:hypothetical protein
LNCLAALWPAVLPDLQALAAFIRTNNRVPARAEMWEFGASGDLTETLPGTANFGRQLAYLEDLVDFIERNRRFPTEQEMPDLFR